MTDIYEVPTAIKHDLLAMLIKKYGAPGATPRTFTVDSHAARLSKTMTELRISMADHAALPNHFVLDVSYDSGTQEFILSYGDISNEDQSSQA